MNKIKKIILIISAVIPSVLRIRLLNLFGYNINQKARLNLFSIFYAKEIKIGAFAKIDSFVIIAGLDRLELKEYSSIQRFTYISGNYSFKLGKRSMVGSRCVISAVAGDIEIGEYSAFAPRSSIYTHGTFLPATHGFPFTNKGVKIGDYCWVMQNASVGPGALIESNSVVLPGSSIIKKIPGNVVVYDTPVERKKFPVYFFKKKVEDTNLVELIKEITINYLTSIKSDKYSFDFKINADSISISFRNKVFTIYFSPVPKDIDAASDKFNKIFFYYDLDINLMKARQFICYDFRNITSSYTELPGFLLEFDDFSFFNYGLKFIDIEYV